MFQNHETNLEQTLKKTLQYYIIRPGGCVIDREFLEKENINILDTINKIPNAFILFKLSDGGLNNARIIKANSSFCELFGYIDSNLQEIGFEGIFKTMRPDWFSFINNSIFEKKSAEYDCENIDGDKFLKTYFIVFSDILFALIIVDITEMKCYHEQIKFQAFLLENINCAIGATDFNGRYIYWNKHMETLFQWTKEEIIGKHILEIRLTEDMKINDSQMFERIQKDGYMEFETNCPRKDKTFFPAHVIVASLKDENGNIMALVGIHTDISEHKKLEAALKESNERWQYALEGSGDGIWDYNLQTFRVYYSERWKKLLGYEQQDIGCGIDDWIAIIHRDDRQNFSQRLSAHLNNKNDQFICEHRIKCGDGSYKWVLARAKIIAYSENGGPLRLIGTLSDISSIKSMEKEVYQTKKKLLEKYTFNDIIGQSPQIKKIVNILSTVAQSDCNVLIEGPSGTGKNLIAKAVHNISPRSASPFYIINCGALPETLLESELFGYVKGAFTDAKSDKPGKFALADNGVIFLDEIAELPFTIQAKLLHFIEDKTFTPLGGGAPIRANVRIIAATNRDLPVLIREKKFRDDLYYRLKIVSIKVPPLKERLEDIELLIQRFMDELNLKYSKKITMMSQSAYEFLMLYDYPGNVRELRNMLEHAFIFCHDNVLKVEDMGDEYQIKIREILEPKVESACPPVKSGRPAALNSIDIHSLKQALKDNGFNRNRTAEKLSISRITLWRLMKKYQII